MLDLRRLRLLRELARRGTIAAVAEALRYSPSAVSQQLAALEKETGVRMLEPDGRRVRLTAQADLLVTHTEVLLEAMERAEAALAQSLTEIAGTLRVAAFQTAVLTLLPHALTQLEQQHPRLRVEVIELEPEVALPALLAGEFDIVLGEEYPGHPLPRPHETERHDLLTDELRLVTPAGWSERSLPELASRPFVMEPVGTTAREWATAVCRQAGFEPDDRYTSLQPLSSPTCQVPGTVTMSWRTGSPVVRSGRSSRPYGVAQRAIPRSRHSRPPSRPRKPRPGRTAPERPHQPSRR